MKDNNLIIYKNTDGNIIVDAIYKDETLWLSQKGMSKVFECSTDNISLHLKHIFQDNELNKDSVTEKCSLTADDGKKYNTTIYSLDAIIAVGYRVNSNGNYVSPNEKQFMYSPSSEVSFIREIASTEKYKECNLLYVYSMSFYDNISYFCFDGLVIILNSQETTISPTSIKVFLPENPTEEQKKALEENENSKGSCSKNL